MKLHYPPEIKAFRRAAHYPIVYHFAGFSYAIAI